MTAVRLLVINADDFGLAPGVNTGVLEAHAAGTLSSTSVMVNTPAYAEGVALARERAPSLGIGLHLNLVTARPLTRVPSLTDARTGCFHQLGTLIGRALAGAVRAEDVRRECDAQLAALVRSGVQPTHLDSHRHAHALPDVLPAVVASARAAGISVIRRPLDRASSRRPLVSIKILALHAAWRGAMAGVSQQDRERLAHSPHFRGVLLQNVVEVRDRMLELLDQLRPGATELMLHPGHDDAVLAAQDPYRAPRERELAALTSPEVRERLNVGDIRLVTFAEL